MKLDRFFNKLLLYPDTGGGGTEPQDGGTNPQEGGENKPPAEKTFTQADLDRIVSERVARERKSIETKIAEEREKAERMAQMTAEEKAKAQQAEYEAELKKREAEITKRELRAKGVEELSNKGLPTDLIDLLSLDSEEAYAASFEKAEKAFLKAVQAGVDSRLKGDTPKEKKPEGDDMSIYRAALGLK